MKATNKFKNKIDSELSEVTASNRILQRAIREAQAPPPVNVIQVSLLRQFAPVAAAAVVATLGMVYLMGSSDDNEAEIFDPANSTSIAATTDVTADRTADTAGTAKASISAAADTADTADAADVTAQVDTAATVTTAPNAANANGTALNANGNNTATTAAVTTTAANANPIANVTTAATTTARQVGNTTTTAPKTTNAPVITTTAITTTARTEPFSLSEARKIASFFSGGRLTYIGDEIQPKVIEFLSRAEFDMVDVQDFTGSNVKDTPKGAYFYSYNGDIFDSSLNLNVDTIYAVSKEDGSFWEYSSQEYCLWDSTPQVKRWYDYSAYKSRKYCPIRAEIANSFAPSKEFRIISGGKEYAPTELHYHITWTEKDNDNPANLHYSDFDNATNLITIPYHNDISLNLVDEYYGLPFYSATACFINDHNELIQESSIYELRSVNGIANFTIGTKPPKGEYLLHFYAKWQFGVYDRGDRDPEIVAKSFFVRVIVP